MNNFTLDEANCLHIHGKINITNITHLYRAVLPLIAQHANITIDLSNAEIEDSTFLAAMTAWLRQAKKHCHQLLFKQLPTSVSEMAALSHLQELMPTSDKRSNG